MKSLALIVFVLLAASTAIGDTTDSSCASCNSAGDPLVFYVDGNAPPLDKGLTWLFYAHQINRPVPAIADAQWLVRNFRQLCFEQGDDLKRNVEVRIFEGTYPPDVDSNGFPIPLNFTDEDSGVSKVVSSQTVTYTITYKPVEVQQEPESVLISGGVVLDGWTTDSTSTVQRWWTRKLPSGWETLDYLDDKKPRDLYVNNTRATRAREPDVSDSPSTQGFARVDKPIYEIFSKGLSADKSLNKYAMEVLYDFPDASPVGRAYTPTRGIECVMRNQGGWVAQRQYVREISTGDTSTTTYIRLHDMIGMPEVTSTDPEDRRALSMGLYTDPTLPQCGYASEIYLENAKEFMDEPYEWWFNPKGGDDPPTSYGDDRMWIILPYDKVPPYSETPPGPGPHVVNSEIVIPYARQLFTFTDCKHIRFENLNFAHTHQPLPTPKQWDDAGGGQRIVEFENDEIRLPRKFERIDPLGEPEDDHIDYPKIGWFERMRGLELYSGGNKLLGACDNQSDLGYRDPDTQFVLKGAIQATLGSHLSFYHCRIAHTGSTGILMENGSDHLVESCELFDIGGSAVATVRLNVASQLCVLPGGTLNPGVTAAPKRFDIHNNFIYDVGKTYLSSPAILCGWTALDTECCEPTNPDWAYITNNYINQTPAEAIYVGWGPDDSIKRPQTRSVWVSENIVRNPNQLLDDMAGIVVMRDADPGRVALNVVFQDDQGTGNAKHAIYTDGSSIYGKPLPHPNLLRWEIDQNVMWGFRSPIKMNTARTCTEFNVWDFNYIEDTRDGDEVKFMRCGACVSSVDPSPCLFDPMDLEYRDSPCDNGGTLENFAHLDATVGMTGTFIEPGLASSTTRSAQSTNIIGSAGPQPGATRTFLYMTYEPMIHPTSPPASDRTPPDP